MTTWKIAQSNTHTHTLKWHTQIDVNELNDDLEDCSDKDRQTLADWVRG